VNDTGGAGFVIPAIIIVADMLFIAFATKKSLAVGAVGSDFRQK
jgi:hypothetical protein